MFIKIKKINQNKINFTIFICLILLFFELKCNSKDQKIKKINKNIILEIDDPSFNLKTGEFINDKYTKALWHFNEGKEIFAFDSSSNENDAEIIKGKWVQGIFNNGIKLNGAGSYIFVAFNESLNLPYSLSLEGWFKIKRSSIVYLAIIIKQTVLEDKDIFPNYAFWASTKQGHHYFDNPSLWWWITGKSGDQYDYAIDSAKILNLENLYDRWIYLAGTYNQKYSRFYINGELISEKKITGFLRTGNGDLYIGMVHPSLKFAYYKGLLDEIRISSVARSEKAIKKYWNFWKNKIK